MSTYLMSDLHGAYDAFLRMLTTIQFSGEDSLYIIGDVVDRGPDGVKILRYVMAEPRIHLLLGNHELMCRDFFSGTADEQIRRRWNRNGNYTTLKGFDEVGPEEKAEILDFLRHLDSEVRLKVNDRSFHLVHGGPGENEHDRVWRRPKPGEAVAERAGETVIIGHTPVCEFVCPGSDEDMYVYSHCLTEQGDHFRIFHDREFIDLDCCVGYGMSAARLACLRLEDMAEFYEKE